MGYFDQIKNRFVSVRDCVNPEKVILIDQENAKCWEGFNGFCGGAVGLHSREALFYAGGKWLLAWEPNDAERNEYDGGNLVGGEVTELEALDWFVGGSKQIYDIPDELLSIAKEVSVRAAEPKRQAPADSSVREMVPVVNAGPDSWLNPADGQFLARVAASKDDPTAYRPAKEFMDGDRFPDYKAINKVLEDNPWIRRYKPSKQRLSIHAGDWQEFLHGSGKSAADPLDLPAETVLDVVQELERRKAGERNRKSGG